MSVFVFDTQGYRNNIRIIRRTAGETPIYAVLKAKAYGLGILEAANILLEEGIMGMSHTAIDVTAFPKCTIGSLVEMDVNPLYAKGLEIVYR